MNEKRINISFFIFFVGLLLLLGIFFLYMKPIDIGKYKSETISGVEIKKSKSTLFVSGVRNNNDLYDIDFYDFFITNQTDTEKTYSIYLKGKDEFNNEYLSYSLYVNDEKTDYLKIADKGLIYSGKLEKNESTIFKLGLWLDSYYEKETKSFKGKKLSYDVIINID